MARKFGKLTRGMTVRDVIELLSGLPPGTPVCTEHLHQYNPVTRASVVAGCDFGSGFYQDHTDRDVGDLTELSDGNVAAERIDDPEFGKGVRAIVVVIS